jgi:hypothetical protein
MKKEMQQYMLHVFDVTNFSFLHLNLHIYLECQI